MKKNWQLWVGVLFVAALGGAYACSPATNGTAPAAGTLTLKLMME